MVRVRWQSSATRIRVVSFMVLSLSNGLSSADRSAVLRVGERELAAGASSGRLASSGAPGAGATPGRPRGAPGVAWGELFAPQLDLLGGDAEQLGQI